MIYCRDMECPLRAECQRNRASGAVPPYNANFFTMSPRRGDDCEKHFPRPVRYVAPQREAP